jgi:hypothetical protein
MRRSTVVLVGEQTIGFVEGVESQNLVPLRK